MPANETPFSWKGRKVFGVKGTEFETIAGTATGATSGCQMEGCRGVRVYVKWPSGKVTKPCSKGLASEGDDFRIR